MEESVVYEFSSILASILPRRKLRLSRRNWRELQYVARQIAVSYPLCLNEKTRRHVNPSVVKYKFSRAWTGASNISRASHYHDYASNDCWRIFKVTWSSIKVALQCKLKMCSVASTSFTSIDFANLWRLKEQKSSLPRLFSFFHDFWWHLSLIIVQIQHVLLKIYLLFIFLY